MESSIKAKQLECLFGCHRFNTSGENIGTCQICGCYDSQLASELFRSAYKKKLEMTLIYGTKD